LAKLIFGNSGNTRTLFSFFVLLGIVGSVFSLSSKKNRADMFSLFATESNSLIAPPDSTNGDSSKPNLQYPISSNRPDYKNNIDLDPPPNIKEEVKFNPETRRYDVYKKIGDKSVFTGKSYSLTEYLALTEKEERTDYYQDRSKADDNVGGFGKRGSNKPNLLNAPAALDKLFGAGVIDIQYSGMAEMNIGGSWNTVRNPQLPTAQQKPPGQLVFVPKMQMNVRGSIGKYINMGINYNTEATFDFENQTKLSWQGKEDDIIKGIEVGNVSLPLNGSLIRGGNSLFGIKTSLQFGRLSTSIIFTQSKGQTTETEVSGGAQVSKFNIQADNYDQNRHYFLAQEFRNNYDAALQTLPVVSSSFFINYIEVWVTNTQGNVNNSRDIITFMDLGENQPNNTNLTIPGAGTNPSNGNNSIVSLINNETGVRNASSAVDVMSTKYPYLQQGLDWDYLSNARLLTESEFTVHPTLGYISLSSALNNTEILAVSYQYTNNGRTYKVGEFSRDFGSDTGTGANSKPAVLFTKMLKGTTIRTRLPMWDLMMKNIYSLNSYNLNLQDFKLNVIYADDPSGADLNYLPVDNVPNVSGLPLITVLNLDRLNRQQEAKPDGVFDMFEGVTLNQQKALIIFPVVEPFGSHLKSKLNTPALAEKYAYQALYDSTKWLAQQDVSHNKFFLRGTYTGSSSAEIMIGAFNIPKGAVTVTSNGLKLTEGTDYIVDYNIGKVTIINQGILSSGSTIKVSAENSALFNLQQKTLLGGRFDYKVSNKLILGSTIMHMYERPLTPKTNIGDEPLLNTIIGFDGAYNSESRFLTKLVDKIPFIETKEKSSFLFQGEYAKLIAHEPKSIQNNGKNSQRGISLIDDFEASETQYDLKAIQNWRFASLPQKQPDLFPEWSATASAQDRIKWNNYNARLAFYSLDPVFFRDDKNTPNHLTVDDKSNHFARQVIIDQVFPNRNIQQGMPNIIPTLDLAFYPSERGSYNYNSNASDLKSDGTFIDPKRTWAGMMRRIETNDFEAANIAYIEFWVMDPFIYSANNKGQLYINLGEISEDQLPDKRKSYENGYAADGNNTGKVEPTALANVPIVTTLNNFFDNSEGARNNQDLGIDGMTDEQEKVFWEQEYLNKIATNFGVNSVFYQQAVSDPSNDNYIYYNDPDYSNSQTGIVDRYKRYNMQQGNSTDKQLPDGTAMSATLTPDDEDINRDFTMNQVEDYFQYRVEIDPAKMVVGENFITDKVTRPAALQNGKTEDVSWYQFKIPVREYQKKVGNIDDFKSIRFMRVFLKGFDSAIVCRFASMQLVRTDWRIYDFSLNKPGPVIPVDPNDKTVVLVNTVNIENNGARKPVPYVLPPSLTREIDPTQPGAVQQNEQSLSLRVCNLQPDDAKAVFRTTNFDMRNYKELQMFIHGEGTGIKNGELTAFIRFGTDLQSNYYEYEIPLQITPDGSLQPIEVWPEGNNMQLVFAQLFKAKEDRLISNAALNKPFTRITDNGGTITLLGLPDLSNVRVIMLGVRNKSDRALCPEVWFNELRLAGHNNQDGWAAVGRMQAQLADFGTVNVTGSVSTIGFGAVDKKLNQRNLDETVQYNIASNFELGKFFPQSTGISVPMFIGFTESFITPKYNPFNPDVELKSLYKILPKEQADSLKRMTQTYSSNYSINFTNVKKNRTGSKKAYPWDIENFMLSYAFSRTQNRSPTIEENFIETYRGSVQYLYTPAAKPWSPFKRMIKGDKMKLLKDISINYIPQTVNVRIEADRRYSELLNRSNDLFKSVTPRLFDKNFTMNRFYALNWQLMKSLSLNYKADVMARIEEPYGKLDNKEKRDSVKEQFYNFGKMTRFNQDAQLTYNVPLEKIKPLDWMSLTTRYGATFTWDQAPPATSYIGNTIANSADKSLTGNLNMIKLYNKSKALRSINQGRPPVKKKKIDDEKDKGKGDDNNKEEKKKDELNSFHYFLRGIMMVRNINFSYTKRDAMILPGFNRNVDFVGNNFNWNTPGLPFAFGEQDPNKRYELAAAGFLSDDKRLISPFTINSSQTINMRSTIEPIKDFRIDLTFEQTYSENTVGQFKYDTTEGFNDFRDLSTNKTGTFSSTYIFTKTAFEKAGSKDNGYASKSFTEFQNNRFTISQRLQNQDERVKGRGTDSVGFYPVGYSRSSQSMYYVNFFATYAGKDVNTVRLSPFLNVPLPAWNINYTGLSKIEAVKNIFTNLALTHAYNGRYTIAGYTGVNAVFQSDTFAAGQSLDPELQISGISISERFAPLIGVNFATKSGFTGRVNYNKSRTLILNPRGNNINENKTSEFVISGGYRKTGLLLPIKSKGRKIFLPNDFNFNVDVSVMTSFIVLRDIEKGLNTPQGGQTMISIKPNIQYKLSSSFNMNIYYDRRVNKPVVLGSFPTALTNLGVRLQYTFN